MTPHPSAPRRAALIGLIVFGLTGLLCLIALANADWDPLAFATIGTRFSENDPAGTTGYDGQFVYYIARDGAESIPYLDGPTLRLQRILYPVVGRALALGSPEALPWVLIAVNLAAHSVGAGFVAYLALKWGAPAYTGLIYGLWIGAIYGVRLNLNEPLCMALALGAVVAYTRERWLLTAALLVLAALAKEIGLVFALGLALHALSQRELRRVLLIAGGPAIAFGLWWGILYLWFGTLPTVYPAATGIRFVPFNGVFAEHDPAELFFLILWLALPALILMALALRSAWRGRRLTLGAALVIAGAGFVMFMPDVSWEDPLAAYRVGVPLIAGGLLFAAQHGPRRMFWLAGLWVPALLLALVTPTLFFAGA